MTATGSCLCGAVQYRTTGPLRPVVACHCGQCRKSSGHFVAATSVLRDQIQITGTVTWYASSPTARRGFCGLCGSQLFWDGSGPDLSLHAGALDIHPPLQLDRHIYAAHKGSYYQIDPDAPQWPGSDIKI